MKKLLNLQKNDIDLKFIFNLPPGEKMGGSEQINKPKQQSLKEKDPKKYVEKKSKQICNKRLGGLKLTGKNGEQVKVDKQLSEQICKSGGIDPKKITTQLTKTLEERTENKKQPVQGEKPENPNTPKAATPPNQNVAAKNKASIKRATQGMQADFKKAQAKAKGEKQTEAVKALGDKSTGMGKVASAVGSYKTKKSAIQAQGTAFSELESKIGLQEGAEADAWLQSKGFKNPNTKETPWCAAGASAAAGHGEAGGWGAKDMPNKIGAKEISLSEIQGKDAIGCNEGNSIKKSKVKGKVEKAYRDNKGNVFGTSSRTAGNNQGSDKTKEGPAGGKGHIVTVNMNS